MSCSLSSGRAFIAMQSSEYFPAKHQIHSSCRFLHVAAYFWFAANTCRCCPTSLEKYGFGCHKHGWKYSKISIKTPTFIAVNTARGGSITPVKYLVSVATNTDGKVPRSSFNMPGSVLTTRPKMSPHLQNIHCCQVYKCSSTDSNCLIARSVNNSQSLTWKSLD